MNDAKPRSHEVRLSVPFHDLDPMQVVWHGNYFKYFDIARCALFDVLGVDLYRFYEDEGYLFPIVRTATKHVAPLRHRDEITCKATLVNVKAKIEMAFEIRQSQSGAICARGTSEQVAVRPPEMELMLKIPEPIRTALGF